jgi:hypothetical protein
MNKVRSQSFTTKYIPARSCRRKRPAGAADDHRGGRRVRVRPELVVVRRSADIVRENLGFEGVETLFSSPSTDRARRRVRPCSSRSGTRCPAQAIQHELSGSNCSPQAFRHKPSGPSCRPKLSGPSCPAQAV